MKIQTSVFRSLFLCAAVITLGSNSVSMAKPPTATGISTPVEPYVSETSLSELPAATTYGRSSPRIKVNGPDAVPSQPESQPQDALAQTSGETIGLTTTPEEFAVANPNFEGIRGGNPPDPNGAVGPNHYIQIVNASVFVIFDKQGNALTGTINMQQLWIDAGAPADDDCRVRGRGDPYVVYDHLADRWVLTQFANKDTDVNDPLQIQCIAVSMGPDPVNDGFYVYTFDLGYSNDYPKLAVWPDGYYLVSQQGYNGNPVDVAVFDRATMLNGGAASFQTRTGSGGKPTIIMLPSELEGPPPAPGTPNFYVRMIDCDLFSGQGPCGASDRIEIREFHTDWGTPANSTMTLVQTLFPADFNSAICDGANLFNNCIDQPGAGTTDKEALAVWPMAPANYRNHGSYESLVFNHTVNVDGNGLAGIRWYELRRTAGVWSIYQQGTYSPPDGTDTHRWMGSIGMDKQGNIALGYSVSNATNVFPGIRYAGRLATDPLGLLPFGEITLVDGGRSTAGTRWGDYSAMRVDPVDGCTFWYTTEYNDAVRQTSRIGSFRFPSCNPADLAITKTASPSPATAGGQLFYDITVSNNGPSLASNVVVTDLLPTGVTYVTDTAGCDDSALPTLTCELGNIEDNDSVSFTIKVAVDADLVADAGGPTTITNSASVAADEEDPVESNNEVSITTIVEDSADLKITKLCKPDRPLLAGEIAKCKIFVDNLGVSDARNVTMNDTHVADGDFTIVQAVSSQGSCNISSNVVDCDLGTLSATGPFNRAIVKITLTADEAVDINNFATVESDTPDLVTGNNMAQGSIHVDALSDLALTKSDDVDPVTAGLTLEYTLDVTNNGPSVAANVQIEDNLPSGVSINSVSATGGASCNAGVPGDPFQPTTCNFDSLAFGATETMTIVVTVLPGTTGILHNDAEVSSDNFDDNNANNLASEDTVVETEADLIVDKSDSPDPVLAGGLLTYTIDVTNDGPSTALDVILNDTLPSEVIFTSASATNGGPCNFINPGSVECALGDLQPSETVKVFIQVTVDPTVADGTTITNSVVVTSLTPDPDGATDTEDTLVVAAADLWIDKTGNFPTGNSSGTLLYHLTVHNEPGCSEDDPQICGSGGPSDALNVVVVDTLPVTPKKVIVEFVSENCTYDEVAHEVTCTEPVLQYGSSVTFDIQVTTKGNLGEILNTATVSSDTADPDTANNTDDLLMVVSGGTGNPGGGGGGGGRGR